MVSIVANQSILSSRPTGEQNRGKDYNGKMDLTQKHCVLCEGGTPPLGAEEIEEYKKSVPGWEVVDSNGFDEAHHKGFDKTHPEKIRREFQFSAEGGSPPAPGFGRAGASGGKDSPFMLAIDFVKKVADIAEAEGHHPDIYIFYNLVRLELSTHSVGGLSENDFILAAKINSIS